MPAPPRPDTIADYMEWASANLKIDFAAPATRNRSETNVQNAQNAAGGPLKPGFGLSGDAHMSQTYSGEES